MPSSDQLSRKLSRKHTEAASAYEQSLAMVAPLGAAFARDVAVPIPDVLPLQTFSKALATAKEQIARSLLK